MAQSSHDIDFPKYFLQILWCQLRLVHYFDRHLNKIEK